MTSEALYCYAVQHDVLRHWRTAPLKRVGRNTLRCGCRGGVSGSCERLMGS